MNVLLLGNGFDIHYGLPTKYHNFLNTVDFLINNYSENMKTISDVFSSKFFQDNDKFISNCYEKHKDTYDKTLLDKNKINKIISLAKENMWFKYLLKSFNKDVGWIDFEKEIAEVVRCFEKFFQKNSIKHHIKLVLSVGEIYIMKHFDYFFEGYPTFVVKDSFLIEYPLGSNNKILNKEKIINELSNSLNDLANALKLYLECFVENSINLLPNEKSFELCKAFVNAEEIITFNYTNTFEKLYPRNKTYSDTKIYHIHGNVNDNIVLGINPDKNDEYGFVDTSFISFKKYFQRTDFETNYEYLRWIEDLRNVVDDFTLIIMGHSLDITDEDIISELFSHSSSIFILYHDQDAKKSYITNLIKIFGKKEFDNMRKNQNLTFYPMNIDFKDFALQSNSKYMLQQRSIFT